MKDLICRFLKYLRYIMGRIYDYLFCSDEELEERFFQSAACNSSCNFGSNFSVLKVSEEKNETKEIVDELPMMLDEGLNFSIIGGHNHYLVIEDEDEQQIKREGKDKDEEFKSEKLLFQCEDKIFSDFKDKNEEMLESAEVSIIPIIEYMQDVQPIMIIDEKTSLEILSRNNEQESSAPTILA